MTNYALWILAHVVVLLVGYVVWSGRKNFDKDNGRPSSNPYEQGSGQ